MSQLSGSDSMDSHSSLSIALDQPARTPSPMLFASGSPSSSSPPHSPPNGGNDGDDNAGQTATAPVSNTNGSSGRAPVLTDQYARQLAQLAASRPLVPPPSDDSGPVALITGITGQDGSYLTELLLSKGYTVHGIVRRSSSFNTGRINHIYKDKHLNDVRMILHFGEITDTTRMVQIVSMVRPREVYHLAAQSHVKVSFEIAEYTSDVTGIGTVRVLEAIRLVDPTIRFYNAATSELFGKVSHVGIKQNEETPFHPRSPYATAKLFSYWSTINYREAYGIHASNGILFNHESPRRGPTFVTRKITRAIPRILRGIQQCLYLGNLEAQRDWGHAKEYVEAMWRMLQQDQAGEYVIATGEAHSVREFAELAFEFAGIPIRWEGSGLDEVGINANTGAVVIRIDQNYYRPAEVDYLCGDASKALRDLGWESKTTFRDLVREMVEHDIKRIDCGDFYS